MKIRCNCFKLADIIIILYYATRAAQKLISYTVDNKNNKTKESSS